MKRFCLVITLLLSSPLCWSNTSKAQLDTKSTPVNTTDAGLWLSTGAASIYSSFEMTTGGINDSQASPSLGVAYQSPINEDIAISSHFKSLPNSKELNERVDAYLLGAILKFHLNLESVRFFIGPSVGSVMKSSRLNSGLSPSYGINYGMSFNLMGLRASIESHRTYAFDPKKNSSSISELLFNLKLL